MIVVFCIQVDILLAFDDDFSCIGSKKYNVSIGPTDLQYYIPIKYWYNTKIVQIT